MVCDTRIDYWGGHLFIKLLPGLPIALDPLARQLMGLVLFRSREG